MYNAYAKFFLHSAAAQVAIRIHFTLAQLKPKANGVRLMLIRMPLPFPGRLRGHWAAGALAPVPLC